MYSVEFVVPGAPHLNASAHQTWKQKTGEKRKWRRNVAICARVAGPLPREPLRYSLVTVTRISKAMPDGDNLYQGTMKVVLDALKACGIIVDDAPENIGMPRAQWQKIKSDLMFTHVSVEECVPQELDLSNWNLTPYAEVER